MEPKQFEIAGVKITVINLTKSSLSLGERVFGDEFEQVRIEPSGTVAAADDDGNVTGLPEPVDGVMYVVSPRVAAALRGSREDILFRQTWLSMFEDGVVHRLLATDGSSAVLEGSYVKSIGLMPSQGGWE